MWSQVRSNQRGMMDNLDEDLEVQIDDGPLVWRLWKAALAGVPSKAGWESLIYTDADLAGKVSQEVGPFRLDRTGSGVGYPGHPLAPRLAVRINWHEPGRRPARSKTKIRREGRRWLGLDADAEIACLVSLILGCRARSGGKVRRFSAKDLVGHPVYDKFVAPDNPAPVFVRSIMPGLAGVKGGLAEIAEPMLLYPELSAYNATVLIRAAKHFAAALWVADNDPEQAWIQLVSSLEAAAATWRDEVSTPEAAFEEYFPEPTKIIKQSDCKNDILAAIASYFMPLIGASRRLEEFVIRFRPSPPSLRPPADGSGRLRQTDWSNLRPVVKAIYKHRSTFLHGGVPIPPALCMPPAMVDGIPEEWPLGTPLDTGGATWSEEELSINLHTFAYLTRGVLLNWWSYVAS